MTTAPTTREDMKDRIDLFWNYDRTIDKNPSSISAKIATMSTTKK